MRNRETIFTFKELKTSAEAVSKLTYPCQEVAKDAKQMLALIKEYKTFSDLSPREAEKFKFLFSTLQQHVKQIQMDNKSESVANEIAVLITMAQDLVIALRPSTLEEIFQGFNRAVSRLTKEEYERNVNSVKEIQALINNLRHPEVKSDEEGNAIEQIENYNKLLESLERHKNNKDLQDIIDWAHCIANEYLPHINYAKRKIEFFKYTTPEFKNSFKHLEPTLKDVQSELKSMLNVKKTSILSKIKEFKFFQTAVEPIPLIDEKLKELISDVITHISTFLKTPSDQAAIDLKARLAHIEDQVGQLKKQSDPQLNYFIVNFVAHLAALNAALDKNVLHHAENIINERYDKFKETNLGKYITLLLSGKDPQVMKKMQVLKKSLTPSELHKVQIFDTRMTSSKLDILLMMLSDHQYKIFMHDLSQETKPSHSSRMAGRRR